jgi:oxygen-dependent protoporphyrinogen oxidase
MGRFLDQIGVQAVPIPGKLTAIAWKGRHFKGLPELYPFQLPLSTAGRRALIKTGVRLRFDAERYSRAAAIRPGEDYLAATRRIFDFIGDRTFSDYIGAVPDDVEALFRCTVTRGSGDLDEQAAGYSIGIFRHVWDRSQGQTRHVLGGSGAVIERLRGELGSKIATGTCVTEVDQAPAGVRIVCRHADAGSQVIQARYCIVATPAPITRQVITGLPSPVARALERIRYGKTVVVSFLTNEPGPAWWDDVYAIATPGQPTSMVFNIANLRRGAELRREPGGSLMAYAMAGLAEPMLALSDREVVKMYTNVLEELLPGFSRCVAEARVQRWPRAVPYGFPGRGSLQADLLRPLGRVFLAGDYLGLPTTDTAVETGRRAAQEILSAMTRRGEESPRSQPSG